MSLRVSIGESRDKRREGRQRTEKQPMSMWSEIEGKGECKKERRKDRFSSTS